MDRKVLEEKLAGYLGGSLSRDAIYAWALSVAVSYEYDATTSDPLVRQAIHELMNIQSEEASAPEKLRHYLRCLRGEAVFVPDAPPLHPSIPSAKAPDPPNWMFLAGRIYVGFFGFMILLFYLVAIVAPAMLQFGGPAYDKSQMLAQSLPHLVYAGLLLMSPTKLARSDFFYLIFSVFVLGMLWHWGVPVATVMQYHLNPWAMLIFLPFTIIPATLAPVLLLSQRRR